MHKRGIVPTGDTIRRHEKMLAVQCKDETAKEIAKNIQVLFSSSP